jgi:small subunit ribosomal protein S1
MSTEFEEVDDSTIAEGGVGEGSSNDYDRVWDFLYAARDAQETLSGMVADAVRGGLVVDLGMRGFVPKSEIATRNLNNLDRYIGQSIDVKVVEADKDTNRVILSERRVANEKRAVQKAETMAGLQRDQVLEGTVRRITDFGAFVDIGGVDGLLHVSDMAWERVDKPTDIVNVGDTVTVKVLKIENNGDRISLGLKQLTDDPWNTARRELREGQHIEVEITRITQQGAFAKVMEGVEGLIPEEEMPRRREEGENAAQLEPGQTVTVKIIEFRQRGRMALSIKQALRDKERSEVRDYMKKQREDIATPTLGDLFGDVFSKLKKD